MHAVMNVAAVLVIVSFVALQRNSAIDLARIFLQGEESRFLKKPFDTLLQQSVLVAVLAGSVIFSLWNAEILESKQ